MEQGGQDENQFSPPGHLFLIIFSFIFCLFQDSAAYDSCIVVENPSAGSDKVRSVYDNIPDPAENTYKALDPTKREPSAKYQSLIKREVGPSCRIFLFLYLYYFFLLMYYTIRTPYHEDTIPYHTIPYHKDTIPRG